MYMHVHMCVCKYAGAYELYVHVFKTRYNPKLYNVDVLHGNFFIKYN